MAGDPLDTDPDDLHCCASGLETGATTAFAECRRFSADAEGARAGFPGRARSKFDDVLDHWSTENNFIAGVVDNLAADVRAARSGYLATDGGNAAALRAVSSQRGGAGVDSTSLNL